MLAKNGGLIDISKEMGKKAIKEDGSGEEARYN